jgi:bifunctional phosphoglucose/phosphomannose isomerase
MATSSHKPLASYRERVADFPNQFSLGLEAAGRVVVPHGPFERIIFCGMGGSALGAEFVNTFLDLNPDGVIHREYGLPNDATHKSVVIVTSFSGETKEALSAAQEAAEKDFPLVVISAGGKLTKFAEEKKLPLVRLVPGGPARLSVAQQIASLMQILFNAGVVEDTSEALVAAAAEVAQLRDIEDQAKKLVETLGEKTPLIYSDRRMSAVARSWKILMNETAKRAAFYGVMPESAHNEIESFGAIADKFVLVTLREEKESQRIEKSITRVEELANKAGLDVVTVHAKGTNYLEQLLHVLWLGEWVTLLFAEKEGANPTEIPLITAFRK